MSSRRIVRSLAVCLASLVFSSPALAWQNGDPGHFLHSLKLLLEKLERGVDFNEYKWRRVNPAAPWAPRAGLESVELDGRFYVMGGRTPLPPPAPPFASLIQRDVWVSDDRGRNWESLGEAPWPARAFFEAVQKDGFIYVMGGQNFDLVCPVPDGCPPAEAFPVSTFYNDVWRSSNGIDWELMTDDAGWEGRAGLSSVVFQGWIYVFAGAQGDDPAIGGAGREFFRDVWKSRDGRDWVRVTRRVPWEGRGGASAVVKDGAIYMMGGEAGFLDPAFADVWKTKNGRHWKRLTRRAWKSRSGHKCGVLWNNILCFGGFNLFGNPMDVQKSSDGIHWEALRRPAAPPWRAASPEDIKYDFDVIVLNRGLRQSLYTFGGDRETFDFPTDPGTGGPPGSGDPGDWPTEPYDLRVDNDVWRFAPRR